MDEIFNQLVTCIETYDNDQTAKLVAIESCLAPNTEKIEVLEKSFNEK